MPKVIDAISEAVIDAPPEVVYKEILDLFEGTAHWQVPNTYKKHHENTPIRQIGAVYDVRITGNGVVVKLTSTITKMVENRLIEFEEGGDFAGTATWIFEPNNGKTNLKFRWKTSPNGLVWKFLCIFTSAEQIEKGHTKSNLEAFKILNEYLNKN